MYKTNEVYGNLRTKNGNLYTSPKNANQPGGYNDSCFDTVSPFRKGTEEYKAWLKNMQG